MIARLAQRIGRRAVLLALSSAALALCYAVPTIKLERATYSFLVALDITQSMNARDAGAPGRPLSRLAFAKEALQQTLAGLPCGSRVGWAIFTEYRVLVLLAPVEVCANWAELTTVLERIDGRMTWAGASEIAKGLHSGLRGVAALGGGSALVFVTDGHEAPPLHPRLRPRFDGRPGEVPGLIVGVGGEALVPIPKFDPDGRPIGLWEAGEVAQTDTFSAGRSGSAGGERMVGADEAPPPVRQEHLSSLKEAYLQQLAAETGLGYVRLASPQTLGDALLQERYATTAPVDSDLRRVPAALALLLLVAAHWPRRNNGRATPAP